MMAAFRIPEVEKPDESERRAAVLNKLARAKARFGTPFDASKYAQASVEDIENFADEFLASAIFARRPVKQENPNGLDFGVFNPYDPAAYTRGN
ncbi:MAG TPA: hypothetical protein VGK38_12920 [Prolixibacteraceae bacterium]|jgi:hypothetical protein